MKTLIYLAAALLFILHHDFWWWNEAEPLVFGFIPISLAYHSLYSILAAGIWALAIRYAWPRDIEEFADEGQEKHNS